PKSSLSEMNGKMFLGHQLTTVKEAKVQKSGHQSSVLLLHLCCILQYSSSICAVYFSTPPLFVLYTSVLLLHLCCILQYSSSICAVYFSTPPPFVLYTSVLLLHLCCILQYSSSICAVYFSTPPPFVLYTVLYTLQQLWNFYIWGTNPKKHNSYMLCSRCIKHHFSP